MKKVLAMAAVAALAAGVSAYAANPFSDVSTSDWAYQAVSTLSDQGVVEGYPDGTFKGQNNITRYEMAQIVARLMAKEDQLNAEQKATVDKLAGEYADELDNLGVRVSNLEKKVGNISWYGDARMRYQDKGNDKDSYNGRIRLNLVGQVNDSTKVVGRLNSTVADFKDGSSADTVMDRLYVNHDFGAAALKLGRYEVDMGTQSAWLYSNAFDGAELTTKLGDNVTLGVGYGRFVDVGDNTETYKLKDGTELVDPEYGDAFGDSEAFYAQAKANLGFAKLGVDYYTVNDYGVYTADATGLKTKTGTASSSVIGANLVVPVGQAYVFGDYYKDTDAANDPVVWAAGLGYGKLDLAKAGSFALSAAYYDVDAGLYHKGMTGAQVNDAFFGTAGNFWYATGDVTLAKNTSLHAEYAFGSDVDNGADLDDSWTVSLNYKF